MSGQDAMTDRMARTLHSVHDRFPVRGRFTIARSSLSAIDVVTVHLSHNGFTGRGECRPYPRYGESVASVTNQIESWRDALVTLPTEALLAHCATLAPGAAANAVESAAVDLICKRRGIRAWDLLGCPAPTPRVTAFTLSVDHPDRMADAAVAASAYPLLKVKVGADAAVAQFDAVARARPDARFIVDANESLDADGLVALAAACTGRRVVLIEQPMAAGDPLPALPADAPPICADESLHTLADLARLRAAGFRAVNVKLDKTGGPQRGLALIRAARVDGFTVMAGCMVGSSLAMAPMVAISEDADVLDLDGPLLLAADRDTRLAYAGASVGVPAPELWG